MSRPVVGVDVDLTVCDDVIFGWWQDLCEECGVVRDFPIGVVDYDLRVYFSDILPSLGHTDGLDYWRRANVYDRLSPVPDSVKVLESFSKVYDIVFVSTIKGHHHKSKFEWVRKHFPFAKGFLATKEKNFVDVDIIIDDRNKVLNLFKGKSVQCIKRETPFTQDQALLVEDVIKFKDWSDLPKEIIQFSTLKKATADEQQRLH